MANLEQIVSRKTENDTKWKNSSRQNGIIPLPCRTPG